MSACRRRPFSARGPVEWLLVAAFVATALLTGAPSGTPVLAAAACTEKPKPAKLAFTLKDLAGQKVTLSKFKGQVVLLDFWATWCIPCRTEIPGFVKLQAKYADKGLQIVGVSVDDPLDKLQPYAAEMQMNYPVLQARGNSQILDAFGPIPSVPMSVLITRDGTICNRHVGVASMDVFEQEIGSLL